MKLPTLIFSLVSIVLFPLVVHATGNEVLRINVSQAEVAVDALGRGGVGFQALAEAPEQLGRNRVVMDRSERSAPLGRGMLRHASEDVAGLCRGAAGSQHALQGNVAGAHHQAADLFERRSVQSAHPPPRSDPLQQAGASQAPASLTRRLLRQTRQGPHRADIQIGAVRRQPAQQRDPLRQCEICHRHRISRVTSLATFLRTAAARASFHACSLSGRSLFSRAARKRAGLKPFSRSSRSSGVISFMATWSDSHAR